MVTNFFIEKMPIRASDKCLFRLGVSGVDMFQSKNKDCILKYKILYTILILFVYLIGKSLPLYMVELSAYIHKSVDAEALLMQTISGDIYQCSLFALGISPYMISSIIVQVISSLRSSESRARISPKKMNKMVLVFTLILAILQAVIHVQDLQFRVLGYELMIAKIVAVFEMVAGVMIILWLSSRNKQYGIGGQSALIFVNILDGISTTLKGHEITELYLPLMVSVIVMIIMIIMENSEMRIPVQRISIHNIYADKNYLAIKLNPIGVMPAMFSTAFFMVPQILIALLIWIFPENTNLLWMKDHMSLSEPFGIAVYIVLLYCLTIGFSRVFVNPKEITEQYLKSGDSLLNLHAGRDTRKYLSKVINRISFLSATVMGVCLGVPLVLQMMGEFDSALVTLPSSVMMLTGIWCNLYREVEAIKDLEAYKPFI